MADQPSRGKGWLIRNRQRLFGNGDLASSSASQPQAPPLKPHTPIDYSNAHLQEQSPLFSTIPPEIRNRIFWLVLQEYDDPERPYKRNTYYTRPGCMGPPKIDTALLGTCKRVYTETKVVPLQSVEICYHLGHVQRASPASGSSSIPKMNSVGDLCTGELWSNIKRVRFTAQLYGLTASNIHHRLGHRDDQGSKIAMVGKVTNPEVVTISIRYQDWWWWESDRPLSITTTGWKDIKLPDTVRKVVMELETRDSEVKRKQLDTIIDGFFKFPNQCKYGREDGMEFTVSKKTGVQEWIWDGPTSYGDGLKFPHHPEGDTMGYVVKVLTWELSGGRD
ncbi:hypothetical protein K504DRAFT_440817 [Pleomassaria siparia CBS 279.74]|uniref:Uncharacterized protein n=1 Tax=Pleomassaria siparia CBS 279.74 TaxID=1314801 RepID=A0A6G1JWU0_9PLEO|nr:hypothetical protein K504DRAFT_440817 [Pleomassaria siparia CBS 279.74]